MTRGASSELGSLPSTEPEPDPPSPLRPAPAATERRARRGAVGLLLLGLALCLLALVYESQRAGRLEKRVEELSGALSEAQATVAAHREHLGAIQERVSELRTRFEALETMVGQDPAPGPPPPSAGD